MERVIPNNLEKAILFPLMGPDSEKQTQQNYTKKIEKFEKECEKSFIKTLSRLSIDATVKTDRYSLPYKEECVVTLNGESYMNGPYEFHRVARRFVKELLDKNVYKIRFYIWVDVDTKAGFMGNVTYRLRYYIH
jgi:hypothetical protein